MSIEHVEDKVARRWWSLPRNSVLPLSRGGFCHVLFQGYPGGSAGPDVQDAVLQFSYGERLVGAVEFHVHASDWWTHRHHLDPRYNVVLLHVVLTCDEPFSTIRQDGRVVPVCSLFDLPISFGEMLHPDRLWNVSLWPCQVLLQQLTEDERNKLLLHAGMLRFEEKTQRFVEQLHTLDRAPDMEDDVLSCPYDYCFIPALAEGLGYGRDREMFRAIGLYLIGKTRRLPEPPGRSPEPAPLDNLRLRVLVRLIERWCMKSQPGLWQAFRRLLEPATVIRQEQEATSLRLHALRTIFSQTGLSIGRADILICNVVLPFAAAVALIERQPQLEICARNLYAMHPGLPSNRITRMMSAQLLLAEEPSGSCRQQGLHYIYQQTCQAKRCELCIMRKKDV